MSASMFRSLVRNPMWWAGTGTAVLGYAFQALALSFGSLLLVQPLLVATCCSHCHQRPGGTDTGHPGGMGRAVPADGRPGCLRPGQQARAGHLEPCPVVDRHRAAVCAVDRQVHRRCRPRPR